ncbi:hypothetical protein, partial [Dialister invisus]|uniref:hypothetical protein n=1 Tax=Dialister invisus TaxID=218538 RepID=UPI00258D58EA
MFFMMYFKGALFKKKRFLENPHENKDTFRHFLVSCRFYMYNRKSEKSFFIEGEKIWQKHIMKEPNR